jgi:hypothetical protein
MLTNPGAAVAEDVTGAEFRARVDRAISGEESALRSVTAVDGVPVDGAALLDGQPTMRRSRLNTLQNLLESAPSSGLDGDALQKQAEEIVTNPPYSAELAADGSLFGRILDFLGRLFGNDAAQGLALLIVALIALAIAVPVLNRIATRSRGSESPEAREPQRRADYQAEAVAAEAQGDFATAVRMLFLDGVDYLESARAVPDAGTTSTATVRRISGDADFLDRFDEIAYGGARAGSADVGQARSGWQRLKRRIT